MTGTLICISVFFC